MRDATKHFINGQWVNSIDGREAAVENPSTEERIATISLGGVADVDIELLFSDGFGCGGRGCGSGGGPAFVYKN